MKRILRRVSSLGMVLVFLLVFTGCTFSFDQSFTSEILSDQPSDGDIGFLAGSSQPFIVTSGPSTLQFGLASDFREYRAFLDFPLDGSTGGDVVPLNADIESASLTVHIVGMDFATRVRTALDLVTYNPFALNSGNYNAPPLVLGSGFSAIREFDLFLSDVGYDVVIDVTSFLREVQARGLSDFQVRFRLADVPGADGFVSIDDRPTVAVTAPLLTVRYF